MSEINPGTLRSTADTMGRIAELAQKTIGTKGKKRAALIAEMRSLAKQAEEMTDEALKSPRPSTEAI